MPLSALNPVTPSPTLSIKAVLMTVGTDAYMCSDAFDEPLYGNVCQARTSTLAEDNLPVFLVEDNKATDGDQGKDAVSFATDLSRAIGCVA